MPNLTYKAHNSLLTAWGDLTLGLLTAAPNPDGTGVTEPDLATGYARQDFGYALTQAEGITTLLNDANIIFGPALNDWTSVSYFGVFDAAGDLVVYGRMRTERTNPTGKTISIPAGKIALRLR